jgi:hypothetical protein
MPGRRTRTSSCWAESRRASVAPDVPVALGGVGEPGVLAARVVRDEVEHDPDVSPSCFDDQVLEVGEGPEVRMHVVKSATSYPQSLFGDGNVGLSQPRRRRASR